MTTPPPPDGPPAGWYPDPEGVDELRWWDGTSWSHSTRANLTVSGNADAVAAGSNPAPGDAGPKSEKPQPAVETWLGETLRVARARSGNYLAMIVVFVLPFTLLSALGFYYGLRDTSISFSEPGSEAAQAVAGPDISYGGSPWALVAGFALLAFSRLPATVLRAAVARQVVADSTDRPQTWSESVRGALGGRLVTAAVVRTVLTLAPWLLLVAALLWSPLLILLVPVALIAVVLLWTRLAFVDVVAGAAPVNESTIGASWRVSGNGSAGVFGRILALLALELGAVVVLVLTGSLVVSAVGLASEAIEPGATRIDFNNVLGPNAASYLLSNVFYGLGVGVGWIISAVGLTLLYRDRGGTFVTLHEFDGADGSLVSGG